MALLVWLGGCQVQADAQVDGVVDDPATQVQASVAAGDLRLIVRAGRGQFAPGIPPELQAQAKARCGIRYLDGLGDVVRPGEEAAHARRSAYARDYNRLIYPYCIKAKEE